MSNETAIDGPWEQNVSAHVIRFTPPDLFTVHLDGEIVPEQIAPFAELIGRAGSTFYMIVHAEKLTAVASGVKRKVGDLPRASAVAYVGASLQMKLVFSLINRIYTMLRFGKSSPITFVASGEEARQWIDDLRRRKKAGAPV